MHKYLNHDLARKYISINLLYLFQSMHLSVLLGIIWKFRNCLKITYLVNKTGMLTILAFVDIKILVFINYGTAADTYF